MVSSKWYDYLKKFSTGHRFRVELINLTPNPQLTIYAAMHQDYSEGSSYDEMLCHPELANSLGYPMQMFDMTYADKVFDPINPSKFLTEKMAGERVIKHCVKHRHWGVIEHPVIILNCIGFPHTVMQQLRTHRHCSFDVQSGRYTGQRIIKLAKKDNVTSEDIFKVWFTKLPGIYKDRHGVSYEVTKDDFKESQSIQLMLSKLYAERISKGYSEEAAREDFCVYGIRQNFIVSMNLRTLMHVLEMRSTLDVQLEAQCWSDLTIRLARRIGFAQEIMDYWEGKRRGKQQISP
jgi:thymidylate synthase (FAD)